MDGRPEVKSYLASATKQQFDIWRVYEPVMRECLARMVQALADPVAPEEETAGDGD
jgi:hypothetical protein